MCWKRTLGAEFTLLHHGVDEKVKDRSYLEGGGCEECSGGEKSIRVVSLRVEIESLMFSIVSFYAPQVGCEIEKMQ